MEKMQPLKALLVAEASGGHLIPALQTARALALRSVRVTLWSAQRHQSADLTEALIRQADAAGLTVKPIPVASSAGWVSRLLTCRQLWSSARAVFAKDKPDVVVGFGGWFSAPVLLAARSARIPTVIHEQNVVMGKANRFLAGRASRVAVSFIRTQKMLKRFSCAVTGMPVRDNFGKLSRQDAAQRLGLDAARPVILVLGGSQGSRFINELVMRAAMQLSYEERKLWQFIHVTGSSDVSAVRGVYATSGLSAYVVSFIEEMEVVFAAADLVVGRSGASTIAELARCGLASILIPYRGASSHQRANAQLISACGGGVVLEEDTATAENLLKQLRLILADEQLRESMRRCVKSLDVPDAAGQLAETILSLVPESRRVFRPASAGVSLPTMAGVR